MEIRYLRMIKHIVEDGGITKASENLNLTQSALSHQLKDAEYQIGTKIFHRIKKKLVLTEAGKELYKMSLEVLSRIDRAENRIKDMIKGETGTIRISTECYTSYHWLPSLMKEFSLHYPKVDLQIVMEATHNPIEKLLSGDLDVAVTSDPVENKDIRYIKLFRDEMSAIVSTSHKWAGKDYVEAFDFSDQNLIIHSYPMETVSVYQFVLAPLNLSPKKITVLPLTEATIEMVRADMGVAVMADWALEPYMRSGDLVKVRVGEKGLKRDNFIAVLGNKKLPAYFEHFTEFLQREMKGRN